VGPTAGLDVMKKNLLLLPGIELQLLSRPGRRLVTVPTELQSRYRRSQTEISGFKCLHKSGNNNELSQIPYSVYYSRNRENTIVKLRFRSYNGYHPVTRVMEPPTSPLNYKNEYSSALKGRVLEILHADW
jgi:hypothetical protein